jgi:hypothetical protein
MAQGKRKRRGTRQGKDWNDIVDTICLTGLSSENVSAMTASERSAAKAKAAESAQSRYSARDERITIWQEWWDADHHGIYDWRKYLESIGRMDLYQDLSIDSPIYVDGKPYKGSPDVR